jgi:hypothetical protein
MTLIRWAAVAAILFAVLFVVGMLMGTDTPDGDESDATWVQHYEDSGNQTQDVVAVYVVAVASIGLAAFASLAFGGSAWATVARASAYIAAAAFAIGRVALSAVSASAKFDSSPIDPGVARFMQGLGFGTVLVVGGLAAAAMIAAISIHWMRTKEMPAWVPWLGYLCAIILLFGVIFLPMIALPVWALVVGIVLLTRGERTAPATVPAT